MPTRILVPVDGSPLSEAALSHALATFPDAAVHVLNVIDPVTAVYTAEGEGPQVADQWVEHARARADHIVDDAAETVRAAGADPTTAVEVGNPARTIVAYARDHDVDHVVLGSHGRTGLSRAILGSVAERVLRRSPAPVTVVK